ncbi:lumenal Hsp70 protein [Onygenales sp. PD_40]|nr:lumenal Hsp70 protein [Onygenales sp. PD_40]
MAPPGRRRPALGGFASLYFLSSLLAFLLLTALPAQVSAAGSAVIGIDLGTEYIKAALVKPGVPLEIVLTKDSKRKEAAAVAFKPAREHDAVFPDRFYGGDALSLAARFPDDVFANLKVLLGIPFESGIQGSGDGQENLVELYKSRYPAIDIGEIPGRGTVGIKSKKLGEKEGQDRFMVEELLAMQLKQVKGNAEIMGGHRSAIHDAVITFPPFYTAAEKRSVELAAELAGLNVIAMISDGLAVGVNYATSRTFPSVSDGKKPEYHVVYDMGAGVTSATVLRFQSRAVKDVGRFNKTIQEVQVVGTAWDKSLGGDALNQLIVNDMIDKFVSAKKLKDGATPEQLRSHGRTMAKLWKEAERIRHILSANSETGTSFEGLFHEDVNFKYQITRAEFEKLASDHATRVAAPLTDALSSANIDLADVDSVILHGGAIRTLFVQKQLEQACKGSSKLRTNVNADEAAVFGATFKGAALSRSFRVKEIRAVDSPGFAVGMKWKSGDKERQQRLFTPYSEIGAEKQVTMKNLEDFDFSFYQQFTQDGKSIEAPIVGVQTKNLTESVATLKTKFGCIPANITAKFTVQLRPLDGIPELVGGIVSCDYLSEEKKGVVEDVKEFFGLGSKKSDQEPLQDDPAKESITVNEESSTATSSSATTSSATESASVSSASESAKASKDVKVKTETVPIAFTTSVLGIPPPSETELLRIKERLAAFDAADLARFKREEAFNNLEAFIYRTQELVTDDAFLKTISPEPLEKLKELLSEASDWLYADGVDADTKLIKEKLAGLKELVDPTLSRQKEHSLRPAKIDTLKQSLQNAKMFVDIMQRQIEAEESLRSAESASASSTSSEEAASSSSSSAASIDGDSTTTPSPSPSPSDDFASLEDEPYTSTSTPSASSKPAPPFPTPLYSASDVASLSAAHEAISSWFEERSALQEKLTEADDPVLTVVEIDGKLKELEKALNRVMMKMGGQRGGSGSGSGSGGSKKKPSGNGGKKSKKGKGKEEKGAEKDGESGKEKKARDEL